MFTIHGVNLQVLRGFQYKHSTCIKYFFTHIERDLCEPHVSTKKRLWSEYQPWVLVSELGQREGEGMGLLGLCVCRGLMEEFRLLRTAFGAEGLVRVCGAVAPRKPKQNRKKGKKNGGNRRRIDQWWSSQSAQPFFKIITCYTKGLRKCLSCSYLTGIPSNCHQPDSKRQEEFLKFLQGRGF